MNNNSSYIFCLFFAGVVALAIIIQSQRSATEVESEPTLQLFTPIRGEMLPPVRLPVDQSGIHPWIAELLDMDREQVAEAIQKRMANQSTGKPSAYSAITNGFAPHRIVFSDDDGFVLCLKRALRNQPSNNVTDYLFVRQPLPEKIIAKNVGYFDASVRPQMIECLSKLAGCGEEMPGMAGQFEHCDYFLRDIWTFCPKDHPWRDSPILYVARNGDTVLVNKQGVTCWFVSDTADTFPLFETVNEFVEHYASFRKTSKVFDSYSSLDFLGRSPW